MKKLAISVAALLALSTVAVGAQEGKRGDQSGGRQAPAAAQGSPGGGAMRGGGMMQQRQARPDAGMQRAPRMQMQRGERQVQQNRQRNWQRGDRNWQRGDRNWRRGENWRYRNNRGWRGPAAASAFLFLGGPSIVVRGYGPGWCRGLHRGYHWAPRIGWHRGTHRGLFRC